MRNEVHSSLAALLAPQTFARLEQRQIAAVRASPFTTAESASGSAFLRVEVDGTPGTHTSRYLVKRIGRDRDWLMRATDDPGREALLWRDGVFGLLPHQVGATLLAIAHDETPHASSDGANGWDLLLRDVADSLLPSRFAPITAEQSALVLDGIAAAHATFYEDATTLALPYLCDPARYYTALSPRTGRRELGATPVAERILHGWDLLPALVPSEVAATISTLHDDPRPLVAALARYPHTLVHGDLRRANLALERAPQPRALLLDWQLAHAGPPAADLAWYLADPLRQPHSKDATITTYRDHLQTHLGARFDAASWEPSLMLGLLGGLLRFGWLLALFAAEHTDAKLREHYRAELGWWAERARDAARSL